MFDLCSRSAEFRASERRDHGDGRTLEGYAAVFEQDTEIRSWEGNFIERIAKGAFKKTLQERKPIMQYDHGKDTRVGSVPIGVYEEIREDKHGLYVRGRVFDNNVVEPVRQAIEAQAITGMSFKFRATRDEWRDNEGKLIKGDEIMRLLMDAGKRGPIRRTIKEIDLREAGPVASPAYVGSSVSMRNFEDLSEEDRESLAADYRKTMIEEEDLSEWLEAEQRWKDDVEAWVKAEAEYRVTEWLEAESRWAAEQSGITVEEEKKSGEDAGTRTTSEQTTSTPEDAGQSTTSHRESQVQKVDSERRSVPGKKEKTMTLAELRARLVELRAQMEVINEEHRDADMPEDVEKQFDSLKEEYERSEKSIEKIEARINAIKGLAQRDGNVEHGSDRGAPELHKERNIYDLDEIRKESFSADDFVTRATDSAKRVLEKAQFPADVIKGNREDQQANIEGLMSRDTSDAWLAKRMIQTGSPEYERAFGKAAMAGSLHPLTIEEQRAMAIATDAAGNFAVPFQLDPTLVHLGAGYISPLRSLARVVQLVGKEWQTLTITEATVYRAAEAATATETSPVLAQAVMRVTKVHGWIPFSMEVDEDWPSMRSELTTLLGEAKNKEEASSFMIGNGTPPNPQGLMTGITATQEVAAGTGLSIATADLFKLEEALPIEFRDNAQILASKSVVNKLRQLDTAAGGSGMFSNIKDKSASSLLGYPIYEASYGFPVTTPYTNGQRLMVIGDFRNFVILDRIGMSIELVPMLFDQANGNRPTGQRGLYAHWRNNSKVTDPNAFRVLKATT